MNCFAKLGMCGVVLVIGVWAGCAAPAQRGTETTEGAAVVTVSGIETMKEGGVVSLGGRQTIIRKLDILPYVENQFSGLYVYDKYENPKLQELRARHKLDEVVAEGKDEFDKQVILMDWVHAQIPFGHPGEGNSGMRNALEILEHVRKGNKGHCVQKSAVLISASASLGWVCRHVVIPGHTFCEMWSNQYRKWVWFDPTRNIYVEKDGVPLNTYEMRQEWFFGDHESFFFVKGREREKSPAGGLDRYVLIGYVPNTDLLDSPPDWRNMFITKDELSKGKEWHTRICPPNPAEDPYFPIGQAALTLLPEGRGLKVSIKTLTPNFKQYRVRIDGGNWQSSRDGFTWRLHAGTNSLEARTVNKFGVEGPVSTVELDIAG